MASCTTNEKVIIIALGPPGVGKGTQAALLSKELNIPHISTGDLFRENIKKNTPLGKEAKSIMDEGRLVPDDIVNKMALERVSLNDCTKGYILDGYPRTLDQAEYFEKHKGLGKVIVLYFSAPDNVIVDRISGRLVCKSCKSTFHVSGNPPKTQGICDRCGNQLTQRDDDKKEVVMKRLSVYKTETQPLVDYYKNMGVLHTIDSTKSLDEIHEEVNSVISCKKG